MSKSISSHETAEQHVKSIRRATRKQYLAEEKIRIVLEGLNSETLHGKLERSARAAGKGLWADATPVPP